MIIMFVIRMKYVYFVMFKFFVNEEYKYENISNLNNCKILGIYSCELCENTTFIS